VRVVLDTNAVVSGLLWEGPASVLLNAARAGHLELFTSAALLAELSEVLPRGKFARKVQAAGLTVEQLVRRYGLLAQLVLPADISPHIPEDPDDDHVLACALAAHAEFIVSGDSHLLSLKYFQNIQIVSAAEAMRRVEARK